MAGLFDVDKELARLNKQRTKIEKDLAGVVAKLNNPKFIEKASQVRVAHGLDAGGAVRRNDWHVVKSVQGSGRDHWMNPPFRVATEQCAGHTTGVHGCRCTHKGLSSWTTPGAQGLAVQGSAPVPSEAKLCSACATRSTAACESQR